MKLHPSSDPEGAPVEEAVSSGRVKDSMKHMSAIVLTLALVLVITVVCAPTTPITSSKQILTARGQLPKADTAQVRAGALISAAAKQISSYSSTAEKSKTNNPSSKQSNRSKKEHDTVIASSQQFKRIKSGPVIKSAKDHRAYRHLVLDNSLEVLIVHDHSTSKGAAAMTIHAGSFWDPPDIPGLAHFLEHMLFLGSEKYPRKDGFAHYIAQRSGSSNAETGSEHTTFYFDVDSDYFSKALDRWSNFFIAPLLTANSTDHELMAVNSENSKNLQNDMWRADQLFKSTGNHKHPYHKYTTGNLDTLKNEPAKKGIDVHKRLKDWFKRHYSANRMKAAIISKHSLDTMEKWARKSLSGIPNTNIHFGGWAEPVRLPSQLGLRYDIVPVTEQRHMSVIWILPSVRKWYRCQPLTYLLSMLGHGAKGSLDEVLRRWGWANYVSAEEYASFNGTTVVDVTVGLTVMGELHIAEIVEAIFAYLHKIREEGIIDALYGDMKQMGDIEFYFAEKQGASSTVQDLASSMHQVAIEDVLQYSYMYEKLLKDVILSLLEKMMDPSKVVLQVSSKNVLLKDKLDADQLKTEKWYGTKYTESVLPKSLLDSCYAAAKGLFKHASQFAFPTRNTYIPTNFTVESRKKQPKHVRWPHDAPTLLVDSKAMRVWHKLDNIFHQPQMYIDIDIVTPIVTASPYNQLLTMLFANLFDDALSTQSFYFGSAGMAYSFTPTKTGMRLAMGGYTQHMEQWLELLLNTLNKLQVDSNTLGRILDVTERALLDFRYEMPMSQAASYNAALRNQLGYGALEMLQALYESKLSRGYGARVDTFTTKVNMNRVVKARILDSFILAGFINEFKQNLFLEVMITGSIGSIEAIRFAAKIKSTLQYQALGIPMRPQNVIRKPNASEVLMVQGGNPDEPNAALTMNFMLGAADTLDRLKLQLLDYNLADALFKQLRTKEMLGYIVEGAPSSEAGVYWYSIAVQSNWKDPIYIRDRVMEFMRGYGDKLSCDTHHRQRVFNDTRDSLHDSLRTPYESLSSLSDFFWDEITTREYWWKRDLEKATLLRTISCDDLHRFWNEHFMNPNSTREMSVMVFSRQHKTPIPKKTDFLVGNTTAESGNDLEHLHFIRSINSYRQEHHTYYPPHINWHRTSACPPIKGYTCQVKSMAPTAAVL
jgi:insulysin